MPRQVHDTHAMIFQFAGAVITLEQGAGRKFEVQELGAIFDKWHNAVPAKFMTNSKDEYFDEILHSYSGVKYPLGGVSLQRAYEKAKAEPLPKEAMIFENPKKRLLVAILFHLQHPRGKSPSSFRS